MSAESAQLEDPDAHPGPAERPTWSARHQAWVLSRHADIQTVLRHPAVVAADPRWEMTRIEARTGRHHPHLTAVLEGTPLFQSGDRHRATRMVMRSVLANVTRRWPVAALRQASQEIVGNLPSHSVVDVASHLADQLPCRVAADMLGLDSVLLRSLRAQAQETSAVWRLMPPVREYARLEVLCQDAHAALAGAQSAMTGAPADAMGYSMEDLVFFLVIATVDSTAATIAAGLDLLTRFPSLQVRLRQTPFVMDGFVSETLRLAGPLRRLNRRVATAPISFDGIELPADAAFILQIDRAHRDPDAYAAPELVEAERRGPPLLAFGGGAHACQGAAFGQAQVAAMLAEVVERFALSPAPGRRALAADPVLRRLERLPLRLRRLS